MKSYCPFGGDPNRGAPFRLAGIPGRYWIVSDSLYRAVVHWDGKRSRPCNQWFADAGCLGCFSHWPKRVEFWMAVQDERCRCKPRLMRLPPGALEVSPKFALASEGQLYGCLIHAFRTNGRHNGPVCVLLLDTSDVPQLAGVVDVKRQVRRLWDAPSRDGEVPGSMLWEEVPSEA